jgi:hypothetical protein
METSRRHLLMSLPAGIGILLLRARSLGAQNPTQFPPPPLPRRQPDPNAPDDSPIPPGKNPTKAMLEQNQKDIKKSIEKLYDLASDLKAEVEKTDATTVLSLAMVRKAEEIEKLARQIKDRAKG